MAMTVDLIVDRVRSICVNSPFGFEEAETWASFELQPTTNIDRVFRIPPPVSQHVTGRYDYVEDRVDSMQVWVARKINGQYQAIRRTLLQDMHSLTAAIVRDSAQQSGEYAVPDPGRGHTIGVMDGKEYAVLRVTLPVSYEVQL
jgi:hypothetical protein